MGARESEHKAVVRRFIERAFNAGDVAVINELVAREPSEWQAGDHGGRGH